MRIEYKNWKKKKNENIASSARKQNNKELTSERGKGEERKVALYVFFFFRAGGRPMLASWSGNPSAGKDSSREEFFGSSLASFLLSDEFPARCLRLRSNLRRDVKFSWNKGGDSRLNDFRENGRNVLGHVTALRILHALHAFLSPRLVSELHEKRLVIREFIK